MIYDEANNTDQLKSPTAGELPDEPVQFVLADGASKLTDWKKEPSLLDLKNDLEASKTSHDAQVEIGRAHV